MAPAPQELRASNKIDTSDLKLEHSLFRSFDDIVRRQLDSVWHTVSYKTKQVLRPGLHQGLRHVRVCDATAFTTCNGLLEG